MISARTRHAGGTNPADFTRSEKFKYKYRRDSARPVDTSEGNMLNINVCGMKYQVLKSTLARFPETLLGNENLRQQYFVDFKNAYFFDRNRECFEWILYYYQSWGMLLRPPDIPAELFAKEISYFGLGEEAFAMFQQNEGILNDDENKEEDSISMPNNMFQRKLWMLLEYSDSSIAARVISTITMLIIVASIFIFCLETLPIFNLPVTHVDYDHDMTEYWKNWFSMVELACMIWFTIEYGVRLCSSPNKFIFLTSFLNTIDLMAILPFYITLGINTEDTTPLSVLRVVRLVRVFRIFKLSRFSSELLILGETLKVSRSEIVMLMLYICIGVVLFSSAMFYAEEGENKEFQSIPDAFWFSLTTMITLGYGDQVPITTLGKLVGSMCSISGVITIALPVPLIVSNFKLFKKDAHFNYKKMREDFAQKEHKRRMNAIPEMFNEDCFPSHPLMKTVIPEM